MDKPEKSAVTLSQAVEGYTIAARARRLSPHTLADYANTFTHLAKFLADDPPISAITVADIRDFINSLDGLSKKSVLNYHTGLSALWSWAHKEQLVAANIIRDIPPPRPEQREIVPFTESDIKSMLAACDRSAPFERPGKRRTTFARATALRDRAILLVLVDTGMRASELCDLRIYQVDLKNSQVVVQGKGSKERLIPISPRTGQAVWRYLATRDTPPKAGHCFVTGEGGQLERNVLRRLLERIGRRAGVLNVHPHRFRHTFAITFLRNGGNVFALQKILGHSTMEMVKRYLAIAQVDIQAAHREASPVSRWAL